MANTKSFFSVTGPFGVRSRTESSTISSTTVSKCAVDFIVRDAVLNVRQNPVLDMLVHGRAAMHQRHPRAVPP